MYIVKFFNLWPIDHKIHYVAGIFEALNIFEEISNAEDLIRFLLIADSLEGVNVINRLISVFEVGIINTPFSKDYHIGFTHTQHILRLLEVLKFSGSPSLFR